jgi:hypothetical protein
MFNAAGNFWILECLRPRYDRSRCRRSQADGQAKLWLQDVLNHDLLWRIYFCEHIFVRVVCAIWSVHGQRPAPAILELADFERIGEPGWSPPPRQAFRIADCSKDSFHGRRDFTRRFECLHKFVGFDCIAVVRGCPASGGSKNKIYFKIISFRATSAAALRRPNQNF